MPWNTPATASAGSTALTASFWNEQVRDNSAYLKSEADNVGLILIDPTSVSGTGVTQSGGQVSVSSTPAATINGVFSAAFAHYRIILDLSGSDASPQTLMLRMTSSGTPNSTSGNYYWAAQGFTTASARADAGSSTTGTEFQVAINGTTGPGRGGIAIDLFNPFASQRTSYAAVYSYFLTATSLATRSVSGQMTVTTSYDGIYLAAVTGNITGTIRVYGYINS